MKKLNTITTEFPKPFATLFYQYLNEYPERFMPAQKEAEKLETLNIDTYKCKDY